MDANADNCMEFIEALGLQPEADGLFVGKVQGFPLGLKIITSEVAAVLLIQVRHWLSGQAVATKTLAYDLLVTRLLGEKAIEIEMEDRVAWVTIADPVKCIAAAPISQLVGSVLKSFTEAGLIGNPELCHYCQKEKAPSLTTSDGKVAQICDSCLNERMAGPRAERMTAGTESVPIALLTPVLALVGALLWACWWIGYDAVLPDEEGGVILVPRLVVGLAMVLVGASVGAPVGWIIKMNRRRGKAASAASAIVFTSAGMFLGELLVIAWVNHREFDVLSFSVAFGVMPAFYANSGAFYLAMKIFAGCMGLFLACEIARPRKSMLKL